MGYTTPDRCDRQRPAITGKIALAHLKEFPDYYTRLAKMEAEAEAATRNA